MFIFVVLYLQAFAYWSFVYGGVPWFFVEV
jgi:hypothetical protein